MSEMTPPRLRAPVPQTLSALALALITLSGCATRTVWQKPETAPYQVQNDVEQCWTRAEAAAPFDAPALQPQPAFTVVQVPTGAGKATSLLVPNTTPPPPDPSVLQRRSQLSDACMRERGYTAKP